MSAPKTHKEDHLSYYIAPLTGMALMLVLNLGGFFGLSPDSVAYISTANNLASCKGFVAYDGSPFVYWPPLYPTLLAAFLWTGYDAIELAKVINAICFGGIILVTRFLLRDVAPAKPVLLVTLLGVLLGLPLIAVSRMAWSEPLFILLCLLFLLALGRYLNSGAKIFLTAAAFASSLACLARYSGVAAVLTGLMLLMTREIPRKEKFRDAYMFAFVALLPLALWLGRNYLLTGTLTGERGPSACGLRLVGYSLVSSLAGWFVSPALLPRVSLVALVILPIGGFVTYINLQPNKSICDLSSLHMRSFLLFTVIYVLHLVSSACSVAFDSIGNRLLSPVYVPILLLIGAATGRMSRLLNKRVVYSFFIVAAIVWLGYLGKELQYVSASDRNGINSISWQQSQLLSYLRLNRAEGAYLSNHPEALYIHANMVAAISPRKLLYSSSATTKDVEMLMQRMRSDPKTTYLVWFNIDDRPYLYSIKALSNWFRIDAVKTFADGAIYAVKLQRQPSRAVDGVDAIRVAHCPDA
jgi:4-amino-4-deoxy-L-arabinose transferase-like glycosyltransferase